MHHRIRRVLSLLFLLTFLIIAPVLIVSTAGYRYNFLKGRIERTGVLYVSSKPSGTRIMVNGADTGKETPSRIQRLLPGTYEVSLERDGYHPWTKTVTIQSRETTFLNNIALFMNGIPESVTDEPVSHADFSPNRRFAAIQSSTTSSTELRVIDFQTGDVYFPYRTENVSGGGVEIEWSPDSQRFTLMRTGGGLPLIFIWDRASPEKMTDLIKIAPAIYRSTFWSQSGRFLYAVAANQLFTIDLVDQTTIGNGPAAKSMRIIDSSVFGIFRDASGTTLVRRSLQSGSFDVLGEIPDGAYRQILGNDRYIVLLDEDASRLLLIDPSTRPNGLTYHEFRADDAKWSQGILLYHTDFELHTFNPDGNTDRLITRLGGRLGDTEWLPGYGLIIFSDGYEAILTEASDAPDRSITILAGFTELSDITIDVAGTRAWFVGKIGERSGLWTLKLR